MPRLDSLTVRGFKSIRALEGFELCNLNVLIGANGAGKSNFIDLFRMLAALAERRLRLFVGRQDGPGALLFGGRKRTQRLEAEFVFGSDSYAFALETAGERLLFAREGTAPLSWAAGAPESGYEESCLPGVVHPAASHILQTLADWRVYHFHDTGASAPMRNAQAVRDNLRLKPDAGNLAPFLRLLRERHADHYRQIVEAVRLAAPFFGDFVYRKEPGERVELEWFEADDADTVRGPRQLSDGTLRFICLATLLLQPPHLQPKPVLIDEPELGLHPYALSLLAGMLRRAGDARQVVAATQSADLVNELDPEEVVVVNRRNGASVFERLEEDRLQDWLEDYALGDLWKMNIFRGRPAR